MKPRFTKKLKTAICLTGYIFCSVNLIAQMPSTTKTFATVPLFTDAEMINLIWTQPDNSPYSNCKIMVNDSAWMSRPKADPNSQEIIDIDYHGNAPRNLSYNYSSKKSSFEQRIDYSITKTKFFYKSENASVLINYNDQKTTSLQRSWTSSDTSTQAIGSEFTIVSQLGVDSVVVSNFSRPQLTITQNLTSCEKIDDSTYRTIHVVKIDTSLTYDTTIYRFDSDGHIIYSESTYNSSWGTRVIRNYDSSGKLVFYSMVCNPAISPEAFRIVTITRDDTGLPIKIIFRTEIDTFTYNIVWNK